MNEKMIPTPEQIKEHAVTMVAKVEVVVLRRADGVFGFDAKSRQAYEEEDAAPVNKAMYMALSKVRAEVGGNLIGLLGADERMELADGSTLQEVIMAGMHEAPEADEEK